LTSSSTTRMRTVKTILSTPDLTDFWSFSDSGVRELSATLQ